MTFKKRWQNTERLCRESNYSSCLCFIVSLYFFSSLCFFVSFYFFVCYQQHLFKTSISPQIQEKMQDQQPDCLSLDQDELANSRADDETLGKLDTVLLAIQQT
jgi:hypothetical protein